LDEPTAVGPPLSSTHRLRRFPAPCVPCVRWLGNAPSCNWLGASGLRGGVRHAARAGRELKGQPGAAVAAAAWSWNAWRGVLEQQHWCARGAISDPWLQSQEANGI